MATLDILLSTCNRSHALTMTLAGIASQTFKNYRLIVADQSDFDVCRLASICSLKRIIEQRSGPCEWHYRLPRWGIAEQRAFLLDQATADYILYLDDDVFMEPWVIGRLVQVLTEQNCGFAGAFPAGLSFLHDVRPHQQRIELWQEQVSPEIIEPNSEQWARYHLHRAANLIHVSQNFCASGETFLYKVAWVASCVAYHRQKLLDVGGFSFWSRLPRYHSGEEVLVQNLLLRRWGGCGILPSGTFHAEEASTVLNSEGTIEGHALDLLPEMVQRYIAGTENNAA